jgi:drug/metabolite transporter (DMT)-like permease
MGGPTLVDNPWLLIPALLVVDSLHYVFARLLLPHVPPEVSGAYIMALSALQVGAFTRGQLRLDLLRRHLPFFLAIGLLVGASTYLGMVAVRYIDPGTAALLSRVSVVFGVGLGVLWLGERLTRIEAMGAALAVVGVVVVAFRPGDYLRLGALLTLGGTLCYAMHAALVKRHGGQIPFVHFFLYRLVGTTAFMALIPLVHGGFMVPGPVGWLLLALTATVDTVVSRGLYYLALRRLDMSLHTILLTLSPVVTMLWSFALFGSVPSLTEGVGGAIVLAGVLLVTGSRTARGR